jgi:hypothetical protein
MTDLEGKKRGFKKVVVMAVRLVLAAVLLCNAAALAPVVGRGGMGSAFHPGKNRGQAREGLPLELPPVSIPVTPGS